MRYGVCVGIEAPEQLQIAKEAGFDYAECRFGTLSRTEESAVDAYAHALQVCGLRCEAANCLVPGDLPLLGENYNPDALRSYFENGLRRGERLGLQTVVLGSGAARRIPEGMDYRTAFLSLAEVLGGVMAPLAERYGVTIVIEPLRSAETNIINTVKEGVMLAAASGAKNVSGLADLFHMVCEGDTCDDVRRLKGDIRHAHISFPLDKRADGSPGRSFPKDAAEYDYRGFLEALRDAGCTRCTIEAGTSDFAQDCRIAGPLLRGLL